MTKIYKVLVNDGKAESNAVQVTQGAGDKDATVRLVAQRGVRYELQDVSKGKGFAPDQVRAKRVGSNLALMLDGSEKPDVEIEDYYVVQGEGSPPVLAGLAENGSVYEYIPQDPNANHLTPSLKDGNTPVLMALGGGALGEGFVLSGLPVVAAAAGGISGWAIAAGVVGAAALGGGGGGGGGASKDTTPPAAATGKLKHDAVNDTGVSTEDNITNNKQPVLLINAESGAKVEVLIGTKTYVATETSTKGVYEVKITDDLADGSYTPKVTVTDPAGNKNTDGKLDAFTVDSSIIRNVANGTEVDLNAGTATTLTIKSVSEDTGTANNDFITSARNLKISGKVTAFSDTGISAGDAVLVEIFDSNNTRVANEYVRPTNGTWTMQTASAELVDGKYTVTASVVDAAGNVLTTSSVQTLTVTQTYFLALNDAVSIQENQATVVDPKNNVLTNDVDVENLARTVTSVQRGLTIKDVSQGTDSTNGTVLQGLYGVLTIGADGSYVYALDNDNKDVQRMTSKDYLSETFTYTATSHNNKASEADLVVMIQGANDTAFLMASPSSSPPTTANAIKLHDDDAGEQAFNLSPSLLNHYQAKNGYFTFKSAEPVEGSMTEMIGTIDYQMNTNAAAESTVKEEHDLFTLMSQDGTASYTFDRLKEPVNSTGTIEVYFGAERSLTVWKPQVSMIDLTDLYKYRLSNIESIDVVNSTTNTIKLNLASVTQAETDGPVHKLYITGDAGDVVDLVKPTGWDPASHMSTRDVNHVTYNVYQFDTTHELLINNAITNIKFS